MSHMITNTNGKNEIAYVGETPWHGLGQQLERGASIETWLEAAGMNWKVQRSKVRYATAAGQAMPAMREWPEHHVLFRSDTKAPLGLVSDHFKVVQPKQILEFFRDLCATNRFSLETAGTLRGGSVYWALAKIDEQAAIAAGDVMLGYVLLSTACDGSRRTTAKNVAERVVCKNTLDMADGETGKQEVTVSHRSVFDEKEVKMDLGLVHDSFAKFMRDARELAKFKLPKQGAVDLTLALLSGDNYTALTKDEREAVLGSKHAQAIARLYAGAGRGSNLASANGTAWGFLNAVTEYVDHHYPARSNENRLNSAWFGFGERMKNDALKKTLALVAA